AEAGFQVCHRDLEDELLRALGVEVVLGLVESNGDLQSYRIFSNQPAQRDRPDHDRLRRFAGTRSGRKSEYAGMLAGALSVDSVPPPLRRLLDAAMVDLHGTADGGAIH
ncbi:MAG: ATP-dependent endonuclease, partial [Acidimicrobiia bacterium]|nr:ATP-dependent endonuclease [Acidimicrobiia bacterium]